MRQFLVVEVLDPTDGITNIYVDLESDPVAVENGFKALVSDGVKITGVLSYVERANDGSFMRRFTPTKAPLYVDGFRTRSAHLSA